MKSRRCSYGHLDGKKEPPKEQGSRGNFLVSSVSWRNFQGVHFIVLEAIGPSFCQVVRVSWGVAGHKR